MAFSLAMTDANVNDLALSIFGEGQADRARELGFVRTVVIEDDFSRRNDPNGCYRCRDHEPVGTRGDVVVTPEKFAR